MENEKHENKIVKHANERKQEEQRTQRIQNHNLSTEKTCLCEKHLFSTRIQYRATSERLKNMQKVLCDQKMIEN